jgi:amidase
VDAPAAGVDAARDLAFAGVARLAELVRAGEVSSRELVELYLERIERLDPQLNAYRVVLAERALAEADQADARRVASDERPLLGVPFAVKDDQDLAGEVTARGTDAYGEPARADSEIVSRLRAAGAVLLGKTNVPELEIMGDTESLTWGVTRNPWNPDRSPGGSSGGSAAAVAAGLAAAATGSDGAGSIRIPAANCGLLGMKPQRDRISMAPLTGGWHGMAVHGFLTRSVRDSALLMDLASTTPPERPFSEAAASPPGRLRIALSLRPPFPAGLDARVRRALEDTADLLRSLGHRVDRHEVPYGLASNGTTVRYLRGIHDDAVAMARPERLQRRTRGFARMGALYPDPVLRWARRHEAANAARINRVFDDHDVVLMPVTARPPPPAARWEGMGALRCLLGMIQAYPYTGTWNQIGQPACAVPADLIDDGLPLSAMLAGRPHDEGTLYSLAAQMEAERPWADRRPPVS